MNRIKSFFSATKNGPHLAAADTREYSIRLGGALLLWQFIYIVIFGTDGSPLYITIPFWLVWWLSVDFIFHQFWYLFRVSLRAPPWSERAKGTYYKMDAIPNGTVRRLNRHLSHIGGPDHHFFVTAKDVISRRPKTEQVPPITGLLEQAGWNVWQTLYGREFNKKVDNEHYPG